MTFEMYLNEARSELHHVTWPARDVVIDHTILVLATLAVLTVFIAGFDHIVREAVFHLLGSGS